MELTALGFLLGILLCQQLPALPPPALGWLIAPLLLLLWRAPRWRILTALCLGVLWSAWHLHPRLAWQLPAEWEGRDVLVEGRVKDIPQAQVRGLRFQLAVRHLNGRDWGGVLQLNWYGRVPADLQPGQSWRLTVRLKRPRGHSNPGLPDSEQRALRQNIVGVGYVRARQAYMLIAPAPAWHLDTLRYRLHRQIQHSLADQPRAGLISGLALGVRQDIAQSEWALLRQTGTSHLLAISGLHISLVAVLAWWLGQHLWQLGGRLDLYYPAPYFAALCALLAATLYALLAGFGIPTQRALIMLYVLMFSVFFGHETRLGQTLSLALLAVLAWDPLAVYSAGFWLSFGAVAVIAFGLRGPLRPRLDWLRIHFVVALGLTPLLLLWFNQLPLLSPLANLIAVPWVSFLVVPLVLLGTLFLLPWPSFAKLLLSGAAQLLDWLWGLLESLQALPLPPLDNLAAGVWYIPRQPGWALLLAVPGIIWLLLPRGFPGRWLGLIWLLPVFFLPAPRPAPGEAWFTLLDVGQGLSAVLRTHGHVLVYDTGTPGMTPESDTGSRIIAPYLRVQGIFRIDRLVVSHADLDHAGGLPGLQASLPISEIVSGQPDKVPGRHCRAGDAWEWDGVRFEFLHPAPGYAALDSNDAACVLRVATPGGALLLTGDIGRVAESYLVRHQAEKLPADILLVPHHGSRTSSSPAFIAAIKPRYALFAVGYRNPFGFPKADIVARYRAHGSAILRTAESGAIRFVLSPRGVSPPMFAREP